MIKLPWPVRQMVEDKIFEWKGYCANAGIALEAQGYTDAPNHSNFPSIVLMPGSAYRQKTVYKFTVDHGC